MASLLEVAQFQTPPCDYGESTDAAESEATTPHPVTAKPRSVQRAKACILIVDDDDAVRETLAELLDDVGFCCVTAGDADSALAALRQHAAIDALVTDLTMPGHDGISLIRQAREIKNGLPAILLTGYAEQVTSISTIAGGNFNVLRKPVHRDRLIQQIELLVATPNS